MRDQANHGHHDNQGQHGHHQGEHGHFDIRAAVQRILLAADFQPDLTADARAQADALTGPAPMPAGVRDMRDKPWSSIDNTESRDLDQIEMAEALDDGSIRVTVAIADVDALVPKGSPLDQHAYANCTSVYTGVAVFPMLPEVLSTNYTSLNEQEDRLALAIETVVDAQGNVTSFDVYRAMVRNQAQLAYEGVGEWLGGGAPPEKVKGNRELTEQLELQRKASQQLKAERLRNGALE